MILESPDRKLKRRGVVWVVSGLLVLAGLAAISAAHAYDAQQTEYISCNIGPPGNARAQATWGSQGFVWTANNANLDCGWMYLAGHYREDGQNPVWLSSVWLGLYGPQYFVSGDLVEISGSHNICREDWTNCNGFVTTLIYAP